MADYKKDVADYLRTQGSYDIPVDASDDDVIAYVREEDPDTLDRATKEAYGQPVAVEEPKKKGVMEKLDDIGSQVNQNTETYAAMDLKPLEDDPDMTATIAANKGLKKVADVGKAVGGKIDSFKDKLEGVSNILGKLDPKAQAAFEGGMNPVTRLTNEASVLTPRTPMQAAFAGLTLPFAEIEGIGASITSAGKRLAGKAAAMGEKTVLGALRSPAQRFPESKLAKKLEKFFAGTEGEGRFNLINESAKNAKIREKGATRIPKEAEILLDKEKAQITDKLKYDDAVLRGEQREFLDLAEQKKANLKTELHENLQEVRLSQDELRVQAAEARRNRKRALNIKRAQEAAIKADTSVDEAVGLANAGSRRGVLLGQKLESARLAALKDIEYTYEAANGLGDTVHVDLGGFVSDMGEQIVGLTDELALISSKDKKAATILKTLKGGAEETATAAGQKTAEIMGNLAKVSKEAKASVDSIPTKPATLEKVFNAYKDLGDLYRSTDNPVYLQAQEALLKVIRNAEEGKGLMKTSASKEEALAAIKLWDSGREARMHLDAAFQHESLAGILEATKSKEPHAVFNMLLGKNSGMTLERFAAVAPKEAQVIVRKESLRRGFAAVDSLDGKASENLAQWIRDTGVDNVEALHKGVDLESLKKLAAANDALHNADKVLPGLKKEVKGTVDSIDKLTKRYSEKKTLLDRAVQRNKQSVLKKERALHDQAWAEAKAAEKATAEKITADINALAKAFQIRAIPDRRAAGAGATYVGMNRRGDAVATGAMVGGGAAIAGGGIAQAAGYNVSGYWFGAAALSVAGGMTRLAPGAMSKMYYSPGGRKIMERIASAPNAQQAALALMDLANALKNPGVYLAVKPGMNDKPGTTPEKPKPSMGKLSGLQKQAAPAQGDGLDRVINGADPELESLPDEEYWRTMQ